MSAEAALVRVGTISGVHGIRGWVKVFSFTEARADVLNYSPWILMLDGVRREIKVLAKQSNSKIVAAKLEAIDSCEDAQALLGAEIYVEPEQLPTLDNQQYYWRDLIGCEVFDQAGEVLGRLEDMIATGANDVMVVVRDADEYLLPWVIGQVVKTVDIEAKRIVVDWVIED